MTAHETAGLLTTEFPDLAAELQAPLTTNSVYRQLDCFAAFTRRAAIGGQLEELRHCFAVADNLLRQADQYLSAAIENVYLHGLHLDGSTHGNQLARQLMPVTLYQVYTRAHYNMLP